METLHTADQGYVRLYGCMPKSVTAGLGCDVGLFDSGSVCDDSAADGAERHMQQLWRYIYMSLCFNFYLFFDCIRRFRFRFATSACCLIT